MEKAMATEKLGLKKCHIARGKGITKKGLGIGISYPAGTQDIKLSPIRKS